MHVEREFETSRSLDLLGPTHKTCIRLESQSNASHDKQNVVLLCLVGIQVVYAGPPIDDFRSKSPRALLHAHHRREGLETCATCPLGQNT